MLQHTAPIRIKLAGIDAEGQKQVKGFSSRPFV